ncbi:MAG: hypothetical protein V4702_00640 [Patescibacteria group bacterium]
MAKTKRKRQPKGEPTELDGVYVLKIVMYLIVGSQWVRFVDPGLTKQIPIPLGLIVGIIFAAHDHFKIDRKIEYAIIIIASFVGFWSQTGLFINIL